MILFVVISCRNSVLLPVPTCPLHRPWLYSPTVGQSSWSTTMTKVHLIHIQLLTNIEVLFWDWSSQLSQVTCRVVIFIFVLQTCLPDSAWHNTRLEKFNPTGVVDIFTQFGHLAVVYPYNIRYKISTSNFQYTLIIRIVIPIISSPEHTVHKIVGSKIRFSKCNFQKSSCLKVEGPELLYLMYNII